MLTYEQTIKQIEKECGFNRGDILNNAERKEDFTDDINLALDDAIRIMLLAQGSFRVDDTTYDDYSILETDMIQSQRDYSFTEDGDGNLILDIAKVFVKVDGQFKELDAVAKDEQFTSTELGTPRRWTQFGNGVFLDPIPKEFVENGLQFWTSREGNHFSTSDTTKKAGIDSRFHEYLALVPSYKYARRKGLANITRLERDIAVMEENMQSVMRAKQSPVSSGLAPNRENNR
jgi:hypothetical protein